MGQKVTIEPQVYCGHCYPCRHGKYNLCEELKVMGFQTTGTASEYFAVDASKVTPIPEDMSYEEGAMIEPLAVAVHGVKQMGDVTGMNIVVIGAGPIGNLVAQSAKGMGAAKVMITDVSDLRLEKAKECGIDVCVNTRNKNFGEAMVEAFGPDKADVIYDCAGNNITMALREDGTVWAWGINSSGQLGDGTLLSKKYPVQVLDEDGNPIKDIVRLAAGDDYVFAVDKNGKIYTWGVSISGGSDMTSPVEVENTIGDEIEDIVSGSNYVLVLTTHGDVFSYGVDNSQGQLGNDVIAPSTASFTKISALKDIRSIAAGDSHNLAVDTNG